MPSHLFKLTFGGALILLLSGIPATAVEPEALLTGIEGAKLDFSAAVQVENLQLTAGAATLLLRQGTVVPARGATAMPTELVFVGDAEISMPAPDKIEAAQLELFTGSEMLAETVPEAVLVITLEKAAQVLLGRTPVTTVEPGLKKRAETLFQTWRKSPERKLLDVDGNLLGDALGDPFYEGYFVGWFRGSELGDFLFVEEPYSPEQITVGQFVQLEATEKEKRKIQRSLHREQRRGRLMGVELADLGTWDTWVSASRTKADGQVQRGVPAFEPTHYEVELEIRKGTLEAVGKTRLHLKATTSVGRLVALNFHLDLRVLGVQDGQGQDLFFHQEGGSLLAVLPQAPTAGSEIVLEVRTEGQVLEKADAKTYFLVNTTHWYPHAGEADLATYDLHFRWPDNLDLVASGRRVEGGEKDGYRWEKRRLDIPTFAASFELGRFRTLTRQAGHVEITLSLDREAKSALYDNQKELLEALANSLTFFEETFGPYPLDQLTAVTTSRDFSQSLLGFVTLSTWMMIDTEGWISLLFGLTDPRTVVAHEVAHQWWGHIVGMRDYRERWISESMANYSAVLFNRKKLAQERASLVVPTTGWWADLHATTEDGRIYESLGPVTLGPRLASSLAYAYHSIVYKKGAVVIDMLSRFYGDERFGQILKATAGHVKHRAVSTETFLRLIEKLSGTDLAGFADQFIYGTGLPEIYYDYSIGREADGWKVRLLARQQSPAHYTYKAVAKGSSFDVERRAAERIQVATSKLAVPIRIIAFDPAQEAEDRKKRKSEQGPLLPGYVTFLTHRTLEGEATEVELTLELEPKEVVLDPDQEVFGLFLNEHRYPKRMLSFQGGDKLALGEYAEAERLFREGLTAAAFAGSVTQGKGKVDDKAVAREGKEQDTVILASLAYLYLDQGRLDEAASALKRAEDLQDRLTPTWIRNSVRRSRAREALLRGDAETAYKLFKKLTTVKGKWVADAEDSLFRAICARATGRHEDFQLAIEKAAAKGADISLLKAR
jgi:tetratricopeptide (TPR) repeat protein